MVVGMSRPPMHVQVLGTDILVAGTKVGTVTTGKEVYVTLAVTGQPREQVVARFKYMKPRSKALKWVKFVLARLTTDEVVAKLEEQVEALPGHFSKQTPIGLAYALGMPKPTPPPRPAVLSGRVVFLS
jgi:hypothetical protein